MRARAPASAIASLSDPAASGRMMAAMMGPSDESGPSTRYGEGPKTAYAMRHMTVV
jgi:hypothetical protein